MKQFAGNNMLMKRHNIFEFVLRIMLQLQNLLFLYSHKSKTFAVVNMYII